MDKIYVKSPKTNRQIRYMGPTYLELKNDPKWAKKLPKPNIKYMNKNHKSNPHGCSNQYKYRNDNIPKNLFCGEYGGSCEYTYPVNTRLRARAALSYARHAPNPKGIQNCVKRIAKQKGWLDETTGKLKMSK